MYYFLVKKGPTTKDYGTLKLLVGQRLKRVYYWEILPVVIDNSSNKQMTIAVHQQAAISIFFQKCILPIKDIQVIHFKRAEAESTV